MPTRQKPKLRSTPSGKKIKEEREDVKHFESKRNGSELIVEIEGEEYEISKEKRSDNERRGGDTRAQFLNRRGQRVPRENPLTDVDRAKVQDEVRRIEMKNKDPKDDHASSDEHEVEGSLFSPRI